MVLRTTSSSLSPSQPLPRALRSLHRLPHPSLPQLCQPLRLRLRNPPLQVQRARPRLNSPRRRQLHHQVDRFQSALRWLHLESHRHRLTRVARPQSPRRRPPRNSFGCLYQLRRLTGYQSSLPVQLLLPLPQPLRHTPLVCRTKRLSLPSPPLSISPQELLDSPGYRDMLSHRPLRCLPLRLDEHGKAGEIERYQKRQLWRPHLQRKVVRT